MIVWETQKIHAISAKKLIIYFHFKSVPCLQFTNCINAILMNILQNMIERMQDDNNANAMIIQPNNIRLTQIIRKSNNNSD